MVPATPVNIIFTFLLTAVNIAIIIAVVYFVYRFLKKRK